MKLKPIIALFFGYGSVGSLQQHPSATTAGETAATEESARLGGKIAFVNNDTLINNYKLYKELSAKLEAKSEKVGKELDSKPFAPEPCGTVQRQNKQRVSNPCTG